MSKNNHMFSTFRQKIDYKIEILSGLTVALALIPEAVSFALIAGLQPLNGLYAAFILGLVSSILGGASSDDFWRNCCCSCGYITLSKNSRYRLCFCYRSISRSDSIGCRVSKTG